MYDCRLTNMLKNSLMAEAIEKNVITKEKLSSLSLEWRSHKYHHYSESGRPLGEFRCSALWYNNEYYFSFDCDGDRYHPSFTPSLDFRTFQGNESDWEETKGLFWKWLMILKAEVDTPDMWEQLRNTTKIMSFPQIIIEPEPFSESEIAHIQNALNEIKDKLTQHFQLQADQQAYVQDKLDFLAKEAKRSNKLAWQYTLVGVIIDISLKLLLKDNQIYMLFQIFSDGFQIVKTIFQLISR